MECSKQITMAFKETTFKTIKLTEGDATFVHYVLRMYAQQTPGLDSDDKAEINEVAAKFK
mgnify:CR=1 FL=1